MAPNRFRRDVREKREVTPFSGEDSTSIVTPQIPAEWRDLEAPINFTWVVQDELAGMGWPKSRDQLRFLISQGIDHLVTLSSDKLPPYYAFPELKWTLIPVEDFTGPTIAEIKKFISIIDDARRNGEGVGVHCAEGRGRTGVMCACYLIYYHDIAPWDAIRIMRRQRPGSVERKVQEETVVKFYTLLNDFGRNSLDDLEAKEKILKEMMQKRQLQALQYDANLLLTHTNKFFGGITTPSMPPTSEHKAKRVEKFERMRRAKSMPKMEAEEENVTPESEAGTFHNHVQSFFTADQRSRSQPRPEKPERRPEPRDEDRQARGVTPGRSLLGEISNLKPVKPKSSVVHQESGAKNCDFTKHFKDFMTTPASVKILKRHRSFSSTREKDSNKSDEAASRSSEEEEKGVGDSTESEKDLQQLHQQQQQVAVKKNSKEQQLQQQQQQQLDSRSSSPGRSASRSSESDKEEEEEDEESGSEETSSLSGHLPVDKKDSNNNNSNISNNNSNSNNRQRTTSSNSNGYVTELELKIHKNSSEHDYASTAALRYSSRKTSSTEYETPMSTTSTHSYNHDYDRRRHSAPTGPDSSVVDQDPSSALPQPPPPTYKPKCTVDTSTTYSYYTRIRSRAEEARKRDAERTSANSTIEPYGVVPSTPATSSAASPVISARNFNYRRARAATIERDMEVTVTVTEENPRSVTSSYRPQTSSASSAATTSSWRSRIYGETPRDTPTSYYPVRRRRQQSPEAAATETTTTVSTRTSRSHYRRANSGPLPEINNNDVSTSTMSNGCCRRASNESASLTNASMNGHRDSLLASSVGSKNRIETEPKSTSSQLYNVNGYYRTRERAKSEGKVLYSADDENNNDDEGDNGGGGASANGGEKENHFLNAAKRWASYDKPAPYSATTLTRESWKRSHRKFNYSRFLNYTRETYV